VSRSTGTGFAAPSAWRTGSDFRQAARGVRLRRVRRG
jgi:hypothetical protein